MEITGNQGKLMGDSKIAGGSQENQGKLWKVMGNHGEIHSKGNYGGITGSEGELREIKGSHWISREITWNQGKSWKSQEIMGN